MSGPEVGRAVRVGGLILAGAALLAAGALGFEWPYAPAALLNPLVEIVLVGAGALVLFTALSTPALDRRTGVSDAREGSPSPIPSSESSLMALPSIVASDSAVSPTFPTLKAAAPNPPIPAPVTDLPAGLVAVDTGNSTLLIPFAEEPAAPPPLTPAPPAAPLAAQTVTQLVDRMDVLQRAAPVSSSPAVSALPPSEPVPLASSLLHRLTRVPIPPTTLSSPTVGRRCNDCGESLGSPPQFEPCPDCGRALCERCYWRTSSGPQAHLCTTCFRDRSVPRPPTPAVTFPRPGLNVSPSTPSGRTIPPRRPVN
jgi:hypothetical protein